MKFQEFEKRIVNVIKMELPGEEYHLKMAPIQRLLELKRKAKEMSTARKAGVMMLFYPSDEGETRFVLILRKTYKGVHSAQVSFPGGKLEPEDASLMETALRETEEEIGIPSSQINVLRELTELYIPPSNFFVQPFVGIMSATPKFMAEEAEVESIIEIPLGHFMDESVLITKIISTSYAKNIEVPAFLLKEHIVWGATAMVLNEVRRMLHNLS